MDHLGLQLNSLDKDLFDSRHKANIWNPIRLVSKANLFLKNFLYTLCTKTIVLREIILDFPENAIDVRNTKRS